MARCGLPLALAVAMPVAVLAQGAVGPEAGSYRADQAELAQHLRTLTRDPRDIDALIGAGMASLTLGDGNAAAGFFARADAINARNPRVKTGLARALVLVERPREALRQFDIAADLGVADATLARDRGLAWDLAGQPRRGQRDYRLALRNRDDPEVTRRLALSLAISGDRDEALTLLDPLLRKGDQAAWRARAFVLALTGDVSGANGVARSVMPAYLAKGFEPFFARLARLNDAEKAAAVNFGHIPFDGSTQLAGTGPSVSGATPRPPQEEPGRGLIPAGEPLGARSTPPPPPQPVSRDPRRRPDKAVPATTIAAAAPPPPPKPAPSAAGPAAVPSVSLASVIAGLEVEQPTVVAAPIPAPAKPEAAKSPARTDPKKDKKETAKPKLEPARWFVQIASGTNKTAFPSDFRKLRKKLPDLLGKQQAWTQPYGGRHRMVVGPFADQKAAKAFEKKLIAAGVDGFAWQSAEGKPPEKIAL